MHKFEKTNSNADFCFDPFSFEFVKKNYILLNFSVHYYVIVKSNLPLIYLELNSASNNGINKKKTTTKKVE